MIRERVVMHSKNYCIKDHTKRSHHIKEIDSNSSNDTDEPTVTYCPLSAARSTFPPAFRW